MQGIHKYLLPTRIVTYYENIKITLFFIILGSVGDSISGMQTIKNLVDDRLKMTNINKLY